MRPTRALGAAAPAGGAVGGGRAWIAALVVLPAALTVWLSFDGGGYFAGAPALAAAAACVALAVGVAASERPFAGLGGPLTAAAVGLGLLAAWALASTAWSDSAARALVEFDRALLYAALLVLGGTVARSTATVAWALRALLLGIVVVAAVALVSRTLPDLLATAPNVDNERLSYPLTYWNALGLLSAIGVVLAVHVASSEHEPPLARVLAAPAVPLLCATVYLTLSRGAIAVGVLAVVTYLAVARPRAALGGLLAVAPTAAVAVVAAYRADLLVTERPTTAAAVAQGHDAALAIALALAAALALRALLLPLDRRLAGETRVAAAMRPRFARSRSGRLAGRLVAVVAALALAGGLAIALGAPGALADGYERFVDAGAPESGDARSRLTDPANNGRVETWRVAAEAFVDRPLRGTGAGTFATVWTQERPSTMDVQDAHSLYLETAAELGIVGLALVLLAVGSVLAVFAVRARGGGHDRHVYAALLAAGIAWAVHAGIDWDWEMPAVTAWLWILGGMALARAAAPAGRRDAAPAGRGDGGGPGRPIGGAARLAIAAGLLALAVPPALMAVSQARLDDAVAAFERGECPAAIDAALGSLDAVPSRPQPFEVIGYCDARLGADRLAEQAMRAAIARDPRNWELPYGLAIVRAAAGENPMPALGAARRLNPREKMIAHAAGVFRDGDPRSWRRRADEARLPLD